MVDKYDRFFRESLEDRIATKKLEEKGVLVLSSTEQFDVTKPSGRLARWIMSDINAFVRENIREEVIQKTLVAAKKGYWMGGLPPFGYQFKTIKDPEAQGRHRQILQINEEEAPIVKLIFERFAEGRSYREILSYLNEQGIKTRKGKSWSIPGLYNLLHNEKYKGTYTYAKGYKQAHHSYRTDTIRIDNIIPPIISQELWEKVNKRLHKRQIRSKREYLLKGIAKCGDCGGPMTGNSGSYICANFKNGKNVARVEIAQNKLENFVLSYVEKTLSETQNADFEALAEQINQIATQQDELQKQKLQALLHEKRKVEQEIENLTNAIMAGVLIETIKEKANLLENKLKEIESQIKKANTPQMYVSADDLRHNWETLMELFKNRKRDAVLSLIREAKVYPKGYIEIIPN